MKFVGKPYQCKLKFVPIREIRGQTPSAQAETFVKNRKIRGQTHQRKLKTFVPIRKIRGQNPINAS